MVVLRKKKMLFFFFSFLYLAFNQCLEKKGSSHCLPFCDVRNNCHTQHTFGTNRSCFGIGLRSLWYDVAIRNADFIKRRYSSTQFEWCAASRMQHLLGMSNVATSGRHWMWRSSRTQVYQTVGEEHVCVLLISLSRHVHHVYGCFEKALHQSVAELVPRYDDSVNRASNVKGTIWWTLNSKRSHLTLRKIENCLL